MPKNQNAHSSQELDKLKRRLIRSVARLIKEKKTEEEVWNELKKECGTNCKTLWVRMRSLTLKKLKRLLDADDRSEFVPAVARMTLTDWLLYDLVLVHEKIDVINRSSNTDSTVMNNLFALVQRFAIEGRSGDDLAEAWTAATVSYNSKGHQCSPMLMQRRWYQIKELTRHKLYKFWFNYRGNEKLLVKAKLDPPTPLQRAIALRYPQIITMHFQTWDERIEQQLVIMPEAFEVKMRKSNLMKPSDEGVPDVVIVEQKVDTITIDSDSEFCEDDNFEPSPQNTETVTETEDTTQTPVIVQVKTEPQDMDYDIDITEHPVEKEPKDRFQEAIERLKLEEDRILAGNDVAIVGSLEIDDKDSVMPRITNVTGAINYETASTIQYFDNGSMEVETESTAAIPVITENEYIQSNTEKAENELEIVENIQESILIDDDDNHARPLKVAQDGGKTPPTTQIENVIDITSPNAKAGIKDNNRLEPPAENSYSVPIVNVTSMDESTASSLKTEIGVKADFSEDVAKNVNEEISDHDDEEDIIKITTDPQESNKKDQKHEIERDTNFVDDGIEFADDGIEYFEEHNNREEFNDIPETLQNQDAAVEDSGSPKFDLKLLMNPVVYTTKLDEMDIYKGRSVNDTIDQKELVDKIIVESKPVSTKSIKVEQIKVDNLKLEETEDAVQVKVEGPHDIDDGLFQNESSDDESLVIESKRVKLSSSLLQKPRSRSYNPIKLCKNPDFNTRLRRLTAGFFSSQRNRVFLKACKPMTIDLSKAFETKLVNGIMYLKPSDAVVKTEVKEEYDKNVSASAPILPSAISVQSLMDTTDVDKILQEELKKRMLERNKTINLPNISVVRQINQHLLMAEVAPIMAQVAKFNSEKITLEDPPESVPQGVSSATLANEITHLAPTNKATEMLPVANTARSVPVTNMATSSSVINKATSLPLKNIATSLPTTNIATSLPMKNTDKSLLSMSNTAQSLAEVNSAQSLPVTNIDKSKVVMAESGMNTSLLPMLNKSCEDSNTDKQKKNKRPFKSTPAWIQKFCNTDLRHNGESESLLTIDTLYKVLNTLDPASVSNYYKPQPKKKKGVRGRPPMVQDINPVKETEHEQKVADEVITGTTVTDDNSTTTVPELSAVITIDSHTHPIKKLQKLCCWAKGKIIKLQTNQRNYRRHRCRLGQCKCCCKELLRQIEIDHEIKILTNMQNRDSLNDTIEAVVQNKLHHNTHVETIDIPGDNVLITNPSTANQFSSQPKSTNTRIDVSLQVSVDDLRTHEDTEPQKNNETTTAVQNKVMTIELDDDDDINVSAIETQPPEPKSTDSAPLEPKSSEPLLLKPITPKPTIRVYSSSSGSRDSSSVTERKQVRNNGSNQAVKETAAATVPLLVGIAAPVPKKTSLSLLKASSAPAVQNTRRPGRPRKVLNINQYPKISEQDAPPCSCRPNVGVDRSSSMLVIDGSNECKRHTTTRVSKETRIFLSRRHLSSTERPFYVGKNKILLTNVKPQRLDMEPQVIQVPLQSLAPEILPQQEQPLTSALSTPLELSKEPVSLEIPTGVQVVLLPDGTVSYVVDPDVVLTQQQINALPFLLQAVQLQTSAPGVTLPVHEPPPLETSAPVIIDDNNAVDTIKTTHNGDNRNTDVQYTESINADKAVLSTPQDLIQDQRDSFNNINSHIVDQKETIQVSLNEEKNVVDHLTVSQKEINENRKDGEKCSLICDETTDVNNTAKDVLHEENPVCSEPVSDVENPVIESIECATESTDKNKLAPSSENENTNTSDGTQISEIAPGSVSDSKNNTAESENTTNNTATSRNLLSDLMEMSGILEEDVIPVPQEPVTVITPNLESPVSYGTITVDTNQPTQQSPESPHPKITAQINETSYDLHPIISFKELKYACDNNGLFFKLDLNTGLIVPINVCIQKNPDPIVTKISAEVIDLTDESGVSINKQSAPGPSQSVNQPRCYRRYRKTDGDVTIKLKPRDPESLIRKPTRSTYVPVLSNENKKITLMKRLSNNLKPMKFLQNDRLNTINILKRNVQSRLHQRQRKQSLTDMNCRIDANINLEDSDAPMEEEYLIDECSDDSDDEPLATIAKRMRSYEPANETDDEEKFQDKTDEAITKLTETGLEITDFEEAIDSAGSFRASNSLIKSNAAVVEPVPTQLVLSGAAVNQPFLLNNSLMENESNDDDSQDDCILGV